MSGTRNSGLWRWIILIVVVGCSLSATGLTSADGPPVQWEKTFGGIGRYEGYAVQQTADDGYIITGYTISGATGYDVYLIKTEPNGTMQWQKSFGGNDNDLGFAVQQTIDGGYIIAGYTNSFGAGSSDVYLIKTEPNGTMQWQKTYGGSGTEYGNSVQQTSDSGYIISYWISPFSTGVWDVYLIKTEPNGTVQWQKNFGGSDFDMGNSVQQTSDGGYVIAGRTYSFGVGGSDVYLIKTEPNGNIQWQKTFGGSNYDEGYSVQQTSDGGYIIVGGTNSFGAGEEDVYLIKTEPNGNSEWQKTFGGSGIEWNSSVQQTLDGGYIIAGYTSSFGAGDCDVYLIKTDPNGSSEWEKTFGGSKNDNGSSVQQTIDGGYIIAGSTLSVGVGLREYIYLIKLCGEGTLSGDLNCDGIVNYEDVDILVSQWLQPRSILCPHADIYGVGDGIADFNDYAVMAAQWQTIDPRIPDDMVYIPDGEFDMGDHHGDDQGNELPIHPVLIDSFFMSRYMITNQQYCDYLNSAEDGGEIKVDGGIVYAWSDDSNSYPYCDTHSYDADSQIDYNDVSGTFSVRTKGESPRDMSDDPMVELSWYGAAAYCNWRSQQEGYQTLYDLSDPNWPCDFSKHGYRLATEAEWEYAARGGEHSPYYRFPWGDTISHSQANYYSSVSYPYDVSPTSGFHPDWNDGMNPRTSVVGSFASNGYGLYDMAGNAWEWCNDWYGSYEICDPSPCDNPTGPASGSYRVVRGGNWYFDARLCRVSFRGVIPGLLYHGIGFRIVLDLN